MCLLYQTQWPSSRSGSMVQVLQLALTVKDVCICVAYLWFWFHRFTHFSCWRCSYVFSWHCIYTCGFWYLLCIYCRAIGSKSKAVHVTCVCMHVSGVKLVDSAMDAWISDLNNELSSKFIKFPVENIVV
jgi:hypothetical protein